MSAADANRIPVQIDIDADDYDALQEIATRTGVTRDDVVRRALAIGLIALRHDDTEKRPPSATQ